MAQLIYRVLVEDLQAPNLLAVAVVLYLLGNQVAVVEH